MTESTIPYTDLHSRSTKNYLETVEELNGPDASWRRVEREKTVADYKAEYQQLGGLPIDCLVYLRSVDMDSLAASLPEGPTEYSEPWMLAAWLRRELDGDCPSCYRGAVIVTTYYAGEAFQILMDDRCRHRSCLLRRWFNLAELTTSDISIKHREHSLHSMQPSNLSPVPVDRQQVAIDTMREMLRPGQYGCLMVGPPGTSKSTLAAAYIKDLLTLRLAESEVAAKIEFRTRFDSTVTLEPESTLLDLGFWVAKIPQWIAEMEAWEYRDFDDRDVTPPALLPHHVTAYRRKTGLRPVLLLEEIDKFSATKNRLSLIFRLVDAVYEANGLIITTANARREELRTLVGDPIYRRIAGTHDNESGYKVWDAFKAIEGVKKLPPTAARLKSKPKTRP